MPRKCAAFFNRRLHYEAKLRAADRDPKYIDTTISYVRTICREAEFSTAAAITADGVNRYASKLKDKGRSARTIQAHLTGIKGFTRWLTNNHKLSRDPLASVSKPNPKTDRRRPRRMLLPNEWKWLRAATFSGPERYGMTGPERLLLYRAAIQTALRSSELRSLTRGRLYLDSNPPYVTCKAGSTKSRKDAQQYIQAELAADLRAHIATKAPKAPVFRMPHRYEVAKIFRGDLADARRAWCEEARRDPQEYARREESDFLTDQNHDGEILDFHSTRHTCGAWLAKAGVHPKIIQTVMRHSTITLTMDTYGHLFPGQEAEAVDRLRDVMGDILEALRATGTSDVDQPSPPLAQRKAQQSGRQTLQDNAKGCDNNTNESNSAALRKPLSPHFPDDSVRFGMQFAPTL